MEANTAITRRQALRDLGAASLGVGALGRRARRVARSRCVRGSEDGDR